MSVFGLQMGNQLALICALPFWTLATFMFVLYVNEHKSGQECQDYSRTLYMAQQAADGTRGRRCGPSVEELGEPNNGH